MTEKIPLRVASFFAGVGGIDLGFEQTGSFKTVYANEFDSFAADTFEENFPDVLVDRRDVHQVPSKEIPDCDVVIGGFPCQAFSIAGLRQGFDDKKGRGELFFELARVLRDKQPRVALLENVKNLVGHDEGRTFAVICDTLTKQLGYYCDTKVLNAMHFGNLAQNRERIYIVAFRDKADFDRFQWPDAVPLTTSVQSIIDFKKKVPDTYYYTLGKFKGSIYEQLLEATKDDDPKNPAIYQWRRKYVRKNKSGVIPTLTANQGGGGHNVCLVKTRYGIRKMTPRECFNAQGFPIDFILPQQADSRLYKQAGNSVCVPVIRRIALAIAKALSR